MTKTITTPASRGQALPDLNTPWSLHFDRDGTEDFGIICDAEGNDLVASHLPQTTMPRWKDREFGDGCFWLPEDEGEPTPLLVRQMKVMTAAPKLLAALLETNRTMNQLWALVPGKAAAECAAEVKEQQDRNLAAIADAKGLGA